MPIPSGMCRTCIFPTRRRSYWCRTISTPTSPHRSTKPSLPPRRVGSSSASNGTIRPSTAVGFDMAESELGVLASQCLDRRIADKQILAHEVRAWQDHRNKHLAKANWQFKTADARVHSTRTRDCLTFVKASRVETFHRLNDI